MVFSRAVLGFVLFLVVSITPLTAVQINNTVNHGNNQTQSTEQVETNFEEKEKNFEDTVSSLKTDFNDLNVTMDKMNGHKDQVASCLDFINDNWWKFWMWWEVSQKLYQISTEATEISSLGKDMNNTVKKLEKNTEEMEKAASQLQNENITNNSAQEDAQQMVNQLEKDLNISMNILPVTNLKDGDIVQIKSHGKYYRYLQFVKIENNSISLKGSNNDKNTLTLDEFNKISTLKLTSNSSLKSSKIVNQAYEIQWAQILDKMERKKTIENNAREMRNVYPIIRDNAGGLMGSGGVFVVLGIFLWLIPYPICFIAGTCMICEGYLLVFAGVAAFVIGPLLLAAANRLINEANSELSAAWDDLNDLNNYGSYYLNHPPVAENMNLTTKVGKWINATLNVTDPDKEDLLNYTIVTKPQHGTLNLTQNGSFVYIPFTNYTGNDSFTYKANDGLVDSNVANVTIKMDRPPVAWNMNLATKKDKMVNATFNATDPDGDNLLFIIITQPIHGTLNLTQNGSFSYTPFANYTGNDSFTYKANDGFLDSNIANITIRINRLQSYIENQQATELFRLLFNK